MDRESPLPEQASDTGGSPFPEPPKKKPRGRPPKRIDLHGVAHFVRASSSASSAPSTPAPLATPIDPLAADEYAVFGVQHIDDTLPLPPGDPAHAHSTAAALRRQLDSSASLGAPLGRAKRPKNVKFSPAKGGAKTLARRTNAAGGSKSAQDADPSLPNNDFCDACGGKGHFLCCDGGCLRSFHFQCLEPPLDIDDVPDEDWYCKACRAARMPPPKGPPGYWRELLYRIDVENPKAFTLTPEIKGLFKNVATGSSGEFIDSMEHRPPSKITGRAIGQEDRDGYRLKDKVGRPILCYKCNQPASLPKHKRIISCDFCDQHWHLDCLDPPMTGMPPPTRKWMCPVHSDPALAKKRLPKQTTTITIQEPFEPNNGDIIVVPRPERSRLMDDYEEVTVNRVRYQVPEETIILDFWGRLHEGPKLRELRSPLRKQQILENFAVANTKRHSGRTATRDTSPSADSIGSDLTSLGDLSDSDPPDATAADSFEGSAEDTTGLDYLAMVVDDLLRGDLDTDDISVSAEGDSRTPEVEPTHGRVATANGLVIKLSARNGNGSAAGDEDDDGPNFTAERKGKGRLSDVAAAGMGSRKRTRHALVTHGSTPQIQTRRTLHSSTSSRVVPLARGRDASPAKEGPLALEERRTESPKPEVPAEVLVQSKEDLTALMHIRKLISAGTLPSTDRRALLQFIEGAPILPKLAFIEQKNPQRQPWDLPWEPKKDDAGASKKGGKAPFIRLSAADFAASLGRTPPKSPRTPGSSDSKPLPPIFTPTDEDTGSPRAPSTAAAPPNPHAVTAIPDFEDSPAIGVPSPLYEAMDLISPGASLHSPSTLASAPPAPPPAPTSPPVAAPTLVAPAPVPFAVGDFVVPAPSAAFAVPPTEPAAVPFAIAAEAPLGFLSTERDPFDSDGSDMSDSNFAILSDQDRGDHLAKLDMMWD